MTADVGADGAGAEPANRVGVSHTGYSVTLTGDPSCADDSNTRSVPHCARSTE